MALQEGTHSANVVLNILAHRRDSAPATATAAEQEVRTAELARIRRQTDRLVDALADGTPAAAVKGRLAVLETRRLAVEAECATASAPAPRLHPALAEAYRQQIDGLAAALAGDEGCEARERVRGLVETVRLVPEGPKTLRVEVLEELAAILALGSTGVEAGRASGRGASDPALLSRQIKLVAGTRNQLYLLLTG